jgi:CheY-like chemotaxis protein
MYSYNSKIKMLFIDDDPITQLINSTIIEEKDSMIDGTFFTDSIEALHYVITLDRINTSLPDVLIVDINMPGMDGFEVVEELKKRNIDLPVFILSSSVCSKDIEAAKKLNVNGYFEKPFSSAKLEKVLNCIKNETLNLTI